MSLFQYGFHYIRPSPSTSTTGDEPTHSHLPNLQESGLGQVEYQSAVNSGVGELSDPDPLVSGPELKKRKKRGTYTRYITEQRASIGKYALENGN